MSLQAIWDLSAPAKVNLFLHVTGRRADGYHTIESVFQLIDWADVLHVEHRSDGAIRRHDLGAELPADDLCVRAARRLQAATGCAFGADISIDKRVPWGAGLGGGSSDAATVLLALNRLWNTALPRPALLAIAAGIGADVPFFVGGAGSAFVSGIGDVLFPVELPRQWLALVKPSQGASTAAVFGDPRLERKTRSAILAGSLAGQPVQGVLDNGYGRNDLQPVTQTHCAAVAQAARWLEACYGNSRMSGSGSAVFARAGTGDQPVATFPAADLPPGWDGRMCRSLDRHPLAGWVAD